MSRMEAKEKRRIIEALILSCSEPISAEKTVLGILAAWGDCPPPDLCPADINGDGVIDFEEILFVLANWS